MIVALDYDKTYTEDPDLWDAFIALAKERGHQVVCVTMRHKEERGGEFERIANKCDTVIFTGRKAKAPYVASMGLSVSVWVDDSPAWIYTDSF